jgi:PAS domain S-box-containing protein
MSPPTQRCSISCKHVEERFIDLFEEAPVAQSEVDLEGRIVRINRVARETLGYRASELVGQPFWTFHPVRQREESRQHFQQMLYADGPILPVEGPYCRRDGTVLIFQVYWNRIHDRDGKIQGMRRTLVDITDRKRAEESLAHQAEELERSNKELEHFAYVASHDLQEPLRMVASYTQLLARRYQGKMGQDADDFIAFAVDGAVRMQQLITDLLAYSRVSTRHGEPRITSVEKALSAALANLQCAIGESGAVVTHGPLPQLPADEVQLVQIFQNLIGNAIKFRGVAPPRVQVAAEETPGEWRFSIRDNGIGVDPRHAERIFEVFQRLHTRKDYPGTGIGLAICKKIAEMHGGRIWVEADPGQGAKFCFTMSKNKGGANGRR